METRHRERFGRSQAGVTGARTQKGVAVIDLTVASRRQGDWAVVDAEGEIDMFTAPKLREQLVKLAEEGTYRIVVNLDKVTFIDSMGLGTLVGGLKRVKEHDGALVLVCSHRPVMRVLAITGLDNVFPVHASVEDAIGTT